MYCTQQLFPAQQFIYSFFHEHAWLNKFEMESLIGPGRLTMDKCICLSGEILPTWKGIIFLNADPKDYFAPFHLSGFRPIVTPMILFERNKQIDW